MDTPVRIGIAGVDDRRLVAELGALPIRPEVRSFASLYEGTESLVAMRPDLLFVGAPEGAGAMADLIGALRLLRGLQPALASVVVAPSGREVHLHDLCERTGARILLQPFRPGDLAGVVAQALAGSDRPRDDVFLDLARGFADEINNPLLFLMGHLQLLQLQLDPTTGRDLREQVDAALAGASRIQGTVDRIRLLAQAAAGPRHSEPFDLAAELTQVVTSHFAEPPVPPLLREPELGPFVVRGDAALLRPALELLARVAAELRDLGGGVHFVLTRLDGAVRLRLGLAGPGFEEWRLPRTFEPYYLNRLVRGSSHGLALFLVQTAVHAHRGLATARRLPEGQLAIDLHLRTVD